jgi:hypothetical protein
VAGTPLRRTALGLIAAAGATALGPFRAAARALRPADPDLALAELIGEALDTDPDLRADIIAWLADEHANECREALAS